MKAIYSLSKKNAKHLLNLVSEILDLSKIESRELEINKTSFPLIEEVDGIRDLFLQKREGIKFNVIYKYPLPERIYSDRVRIRQILVNILGNAFKFTEQGVINLVVRMSGDTIKGSPERIVFEVTDTGLGIPPALQPEVFKPFVQAQSRGGKVYGGTGLGLSLSRQIAMALGGTIWLEKSEEGKGSTFILTIDPGELKNTKMLSGPVGDDVKSRLDKQKGGVQQVLRGVKVLLVEDTSDIQVLISSMLRIAGARVEVCGDGKMAVQMITSEAYDVVLLDIQLPDMTGYDVLSQVKSQGCTTPVIALTAHAIRVEKDKAEKAGFVDFLTKPVELRRLAEVVLRWARGTNNSKENGFNDRNVRPLYSMFFHDPDMHQVISEFVAKLPQRISDLERLIKLKERHQVIAYCHKFKGSLGGYGFPEMADVIVEIENELKDLVSDILPNNIFSEELHKLKWFALRAQKAHSFESVTSSNI